MRSSDWSRLIRLIGLGVLLTALVGCGNEPPGCADGQTVTLVKETFWTTVGKLAVNPSDKALLGQVRLKFDVSLQSPRLTEKRADTGKAICAGTLKVSLTDDASKTVDKLFKRGTESEVEYSSQITADGKEHFVELAGHRRAVEYVWSLAQMGAFGSAQVAPIPANAARSNEGRPTGEPAGAASASPAAEQVAPQPGSSAPRAGG